MHTYTVDQLGDDLAHVLDALGVRGKTVFVGHSMGGMSALAYLQRSEADQPVRPEGLVLVASAAGRLAEHGVGRLLATPGVAALFGVVDHMPEAAARAFKGSLGTMCGRWSDRGAQRDATLPALAATALSRTSVRTAVGFLRDLRVMDLSHKLGSIRARTVVVSGSDDQLTPPVHADALVAGIPGAVRLHVPGVGHMLPQDAPYVINEAIRRAMFGPSAAVVESAGAVVSAVRKIAQPAGGVPA